MKRCYAVWNRGYRKVLVAADDHVGAMEICSRSGFIRKPHNFRKYEEVEPPLNSEAIMLGDKSGILEQDENGEWVLK